ncbi:MAG: DUF177 domain-containing protein [Elusimicrobiota bacterium]
MIPERSPLCFDTERILEEGGLAVELEIEASSLGETPQGVSPAGPLRLGLEFSVGGSRILLQGRARGAWTLSCSRCLAEHRVDASCELDETYPASESTLDVSEEVRQAVLLEIPSRSLCRPDCRGLCSLCGKNLNLGPCACPPQPGQTPFSVLARIRKNPGE